MRPAFKIAVNDDLVRKNPFDFKTTDAVVNDSSTRQALTPEQERVYLEFVQSDPRYSRYYDALYILFHTGLRISEFAGLTIPDIDMEQRKIIVDHQLLYNKKEHDMQSIKRLDDLVLDLQHHGRDSAAYAAFRSAAERTARSGRPGETFLDVLVSLCQAASPA